MDITPLVKSGSRIIQSYADGRFRISGELYEGAVILRSDDVEAWSVQGPVSALQEADFAPVIGMLANTDVVLLGCGDKIEFLNPELKKALKAKGLHCDVMDTGAACRTYNVLLAEGRRVVAALLPTSK
jgi:uncharacterized protein